MFGDVQSDLQFEDNLENQYKSNLDMILNSQLLKKIIGRATDNEYMVCMNILGALRYFLSCDLIIEICVLWEVSHLSQRFVS